MSRRVLISGSVAYDTIMVFEGHFKDHILPDRVHMLNVAFLAPRLKREYGGCAANIAYNLHGLGGHPVVLATIGRDGDDYLSRLGALGIDVSQVRRLDEQYTAQAFITTDLSDNQIIAFHPGAMSDAHAVSAIAAQRAGDAAAFGIVAPNGRDAMLQHAREFVEAGVPFIFDPGQGLPMFDGEALRGFIAQATAVAVNDYEASLLVERTGWNEAQIAERVQALIVTRGAEGSRVYEPGRMTEIAPVQISRAVDPTGCGDAYRGGLLYSLSTGASWTDAARLGSVLGAIKIEHQGAQNHRVDRDEVARRFAQAYGRAPW
ncbi:MAG: carbohydrate kinase family protein [Burkholderiales bacterium]|nr:MAG: carbohydrate kinase family protein [Burkholderiales bacterium]